MTRGSGEAVSGCSLGWNDAVFSNLRCAAWAVLVLAVAQAVAVVLPLWLFGTDPNSDESTC